MREAVGGRRVTRCPGTRLRRNPCQATARWAVSRDDRRPGVDDLAGHRDHGPAGRREPRLRAGPGPAAARRPGRRSGPGRPASRGCGRSGPRRAGRGGGRPRPSRSRSSSLARGGASRRRPTIAAVRSPSRAVVSEAYVTPPPSRQPRGSSGAMSRHGRADVDDLDARRSHWHLRRIYCRFANPERRGRRVLLRAA